MGTSSSSQGPKGNQPNLLPPWAPESPIFPSFPDISPTDAYPQQNDSPKPVAPISWNIPKSSVTSFSHRGGIGRLKKAVRSYVSAKGGATKAALTARAGRNATVRLASFIASGIKEGFSEAAKKIGVQNITSRNIHAVLADFIDHLAPVGATIESSIARKALIATITEVFENLQVEKNGINVLDQISNEDMKEIIVSSIANYINEKFQQELINRLEKSKIDAVYANQLSSQIRDYMVGLIKLDMDITDFVNFDWQSPEGIQKIEKFYGQAYALLGEEQ